MKEVDIVAVIKSGFLRLAIRKIVKTYSLNGLVSFHSSLEECESGTICSGNIILESNLIPEPMDLSLANIKSKNPDGRILIIENRSCSGDLSPYIFDMLNLLDSEETIAKRLKSFFNADENKSSVTDEIISEREKDIVKLVALGKTNKEISDLLFISPHTVITHRKNITAKLGIKTIAGLTVYAVLNELINPDDASQ